MGSPGGRRRPTLIVVTHNTRTHLEACLDSILRSTQSPYQLVVVDNASTDGTAEFLGRFRQRVAAEAPGSLQDLRVIRNTTNRFYPASCNQGAAAADGDCLVFLNADVVVSEGWLERLLGVLQSAPLAGAVGPMAHRAWAHQDYAWVYGKLELDESPTAQQALDAFARRLAQSYPGHYTECKALFSFCYLIDGEAIAEVGPFDEALALVHEDLDFSLRLRIAGLKLYVAEDAFVLHHRHASYPSLPPQEVTRRDTSDWAHMFNKWSHLLNLRFPDRTRPGLDWYDLFFNESPLLYSGLAKGRREGWLLPPGPKGAVPRANMAGGRTTR